MVLDRAINFELRYSGARPSRDLKTIKTFWISHCVLRVFPIEILEQLQCICVIALESQSSCCTILKVLKFTCAFYATVSPNNITIVEMRPNQGFVDKMQCCCGGGENKLPNPFDSCNIGGKRLDRTAPGKVCINEYTQRF